MTKHSLTQLFWVMSICTSDRQSMYLKTYMLTAKHKKLLRNVPEFTVVKNPGHGMIQFIFIIKVPLAVKRILKTTIMYLYITQDCLITIRLYLHTQ